MKDKNPELEETAEDQTPEEAKDDTYDRLVRLTADFENFRKRTQKEKAELIRYGNENLVREILPILDNFERAVEHAKKSTEVESIRTGVELILSQLKNMLDRFGLKTRSSMGDPFDPTIHEAVSHVPSSDHPNNTVMEEHQKAYFLHDRLIRPALVSVSKGAGEPSETTEAIDPQVSDEKKP